jgi:hypothetical protein
MTSSAYTRRLARIAGVATLLALYYAMAVSAVSQKSMTFDEMAHLTGGYTYWKFGDYRLHGENGNWPQRLGALPAVLGGASFPRLDQPAWTSSNIYVLGDQFLYFSGNDAGGLLARGRALMALLGVGVGALVYAWSHRLVSPLGAWVSLILFVFGPTFLAHGPLVTSDMAAAFFFTAAAGALWIAMQRVSWATISMAALLVAGVFLSKLSAPILVLAALVMLALRLIDGRPLTVRIAGRSVEQRSRPRQLLVLLAVLTVCGFVTWVLIWASYGFRYSAFAVGTTGSDTFLGQLRGAPGIAGWIVSAARQLHLLPESYLYGLAITLQYASERAAFLNGEFALSGWWWFFPYAFVVKTTIPGMALGVLASAALLRRWGSAAQGKRVRARVWASLYAGAPLVALVTVYWLFVVNSNLNIGHRHLLPIYPAMCILAGGAAFWIEPLFTRAPVVEPQHQSGRDRRKPRAQDRAPRKAPGWYTVAGAATLVMLAWHAAESLTIRPDYLAYFNQIAGGPSQGYTHLADSSLDWGQDLPALKDWLDREGLQRADGVYFSYFGTARPEYYGIQATQLAGFIDRRPPPSGPPAPLRGGIYCVSATVLDVIGQMFYKPEYESNYQAAATNAEIFAGASGNEQARAALVRQTGEDYWRQLFVQLDQLRVGRLTAFLRRRQPDAMIGYSILVYRLSDSEVEQALKGPLPGTAGR